MASIRKKIITQWLDAEGRRVAPRTKGATKRAIESRKWYAFGVPGFRRAVPLASNRRVAEQMLAKLVAEGEAGAAGLPSQEFSRLSIVELIDLWEVHLRAKGTDAPQVQRVISRARRLAADLRWSHPRDIQPDAVTQWLAEYATKEKVGPQTRNLWRGSLRAFARWLAGRGRRLVPVDLLDAVPTLPVEIDTRRARRALSLEELGRLLSATLASGETMRGLSSAQRHLIYSVTCATGLRAREIGLLETDGLYLDESPPCIVIAARRGKNRRTTRQPLPADLVAPLREYAAHRQGRLFPGRWHRRAAEMIRADLARAGIPYTVETPNGPLFCDFHSLRHTYVSLLETAGVSLRDAMILARHSDPKLTLARYGRSQAAALGVAVNRLSILGDDAQEASFVRLFAWLLACSGVETVCPPVCLSNGHGGDFIGNDAK